ncbi:MAG: hypothetical protein KA371_12570 [Acidobacteria bacterium]|nr:hypothetical protein [Acidobacteriota bacterium]
MADDATSDDALLTVRAIARSPIPFVVCGIVGAWLRASDLGRAPLAIGEAAGAWAAWHALADVAVAVPSPSPSSAALLGLQAGLFALLGSGDAVARLAAAAAGIAALVVPWVLRAHLGHVRAVALAVLLALDPIAVASARTADGTALAATAIWVMVAGLLALRETGLGLPIAGWPIALAVAGAVGILSGPLVWDAVPLVALVAYRIAAVVTGRGQRARLVAAGFAVAVVMATTGFVQTVGPPLLSISVTESLARWHVTSGVDVATWWQQVLRRETLAIALGLGGLLVALPRGAGWWATAWSVWAATLILRPGRDLDAWLVLSPPLLILASGSVAWLIAPRSITGSRFASIAPGVSAVAMALLLLSTVHTAFEVARAHPGQHRSPVLAHTERSVRALAEAVAARRRGTPADDAIEIVVDGRVADPVLGWYLRHEARLRWVQAPSRDVGRSRLVLEVASAEDSGPDIFPLRHDASGVVQVRLR